MRWRAARGGTLFLVSMCLSIGGTDLIALAQSRQAEESATLPRGWLRRLDGWYGIPSDLALRFGRVAVSAGLRPAEAARLLNDDRFVAAVGSPDQGWGLLEGMTENLDSIADAWDLLRQKGQSLASAGVGSFQYAFLAQHPELRNAYLADLGRMVAVRSDGVEVLVDIETGRQVTGRDSLGTAVRAPGGGPLPTPSISPEEEAARMWEAVGIDPDDPLQDEAPQPGAGPGGPGFDFNTDEAPGWLDGPGAYLILAAFMIAWLGYAAVFLLRRLGRP